jgi:hypothetical protein
MSLTHQLFLQSLRELADYEQEKFDAHRMRLIAWLVDHAWSAVPAYRARLADQIADESFDLARWCELPLLRNDDIVALGTDLEARALPPEGSEIEEAPDQPWPLCRHSRLTTIAAECEREWFFEQNGLDLAAPLAVLHPGFGGPQEGRGWSITFAQSKWVAGEYNSDAGEQVAWLEKNGAKLLRTTAAIGERLAEEWIRSDAKLSIEAIIVADANLTPARRTAIETATGVPVVHVIEQPGLGMIAASDPRGGYLVSAATCVIEVVDAKGKPVPNGSVGELVVTPLYEYVVPRLRFATGVMASSEPHAGTLIGVRRLSWVANVSA